ncbi:MAG: 50S ribosomal protein L29 [Nitrospinota bacterium]|nr:50S ribosomal protein L29 [Nitrospinota bacterium]
MKALEIRELTIEELSLKLEELRKEYLNMRFQKSTQQLEKPHQISVVKKDIARMLTVLNEKKRVKDVSASS